MNYTHAITSLRVYQKNQNLVITQFYAGNPTQQLALNMAIIQQANIIHVKYKHLGCCNLITQIKGHKLVYDPCFI